MNIPEERPILIAGAGPVGLILAMALHKHNIPCRVFESVGELKPLGVGINLLPSGVRVLAQLGLTEKLGSFSVKTARQSYRNKFGQDIWTESRGKAAGYQFPQFSVHRGKLQTFLFDEAVQRLGAGAIETDRALENWTDYGDHITIHLRSKNGGQHDVDGSCLIAADGINSTARKVLYPDEGPPIYSGLILWRAVSESPLWLGGTTMVNCGTDTQKFVCYSIDPDLEAQGRCMTNWIAELAVPDWKQPDQNWSNLVDKSRFYERFADWHFDWLDIPELINTAEAIYEYPMADREPLPKWTHGRMTLIGDAAHVMYPIGSNGATQGILDVDEITQQLLSQETVEEAFAAYEAVRRPATAKIILANRGNGPDEVLKLADERAPNGFEHVHDVIPQAELEEIAAKYKRLAGFTVKQVNQ